MSKTEVIALSDDILASVKCVGEQNTFAIFSFRTPWKLRYHTLKHLLNPREWRQAWYYFEEPPAYTLEEMYKARMALQRNRCPFLVNRQGKGNPPCDVCYMGVADVPGPAPCARILPKWEKLYLKIAREIIHEASLHPLVASFKNKKDSGYSVDFVEPGSYVATACCSAYEKSASYSLVSLYQIFNDVYSAREMVEKLAERPIRYCTPQTWEILQETWREKLDRMGRECAR
jgi:hypothetical protein